MAPSKKRPKLEKLLTEVELEIMNAIWDLGETTIKAVHEKLALERDVAYTSVATIMKILEQKGALLSEKKERAHTYSARLARREYEAMSLDALKANVFGGDPTSMVMHLLNGSDISAQEIAAIKNLIDERLKD